MKEKDLFSLTVVLFLCLTGPVQCDNSHVDPSPWPWFEITVNGQLKARLTGEQWHMIKKFSVEAGKRAWNPISFHHLLKAAVVPLWQLVIPVLNVFHGSQFLIHQDSGYSLWNQLFRLWLSKNLWPNAQRLHLLRILTINLCLYPSLPFKVMLLSLQSQG